MATDIQPAPAPDRRRSTPHHRDIGGAGGGTRDRQRDEPDAGKQMPFQEMCFHRRRPPAPIQTDIVSREARRPCVIPGTRSIRNWCPQQPCLLIGGARHLAAARALLQSERPCTARNRTQTARCSTSACSACLVTLGAAGRKKIFRRLSQPEGRSPHATTKVADRPGARDRSSEEFLIDARRPVLNRACSSGRHEPRRSSDGRS